jgi:hypothetical protein
VSIITGLSKRTSLSLNNQTLVIQY